MPQDTCSPDASVQIFISDIYTVTFFTLFMRPSIYWAILRIATVRPSVRLINPEQKGGKYFKFGGNIPRCTCNIFEQKGA